MTGLFYAHSGLRYLVLLLGIVNVVVLASALARSAPVGKLHRALGAAFAGLLHLQVLLGLGMVLGGTWYPQLIGHIVLMIAAAAVAQVALSMNRRRPEPGHKLPLAGVVGSLVLIAAGVMAIGRGLFATGTFSG